MGDAQIGIIRAGGEMVRRHAVGTKQRKVFNISRRLHLLAINCVGKPHHLARPRAARENATQTALPQRRGGRFPRVKVRAPGIEQPRSLRPGFLASPVWAGVKSR
jgi:hypothetical protein